VQVIPRPHEDLAAFVPKAKGKAAAAAGEKKR
jgi:microcompartment protein CcmL/EutN